MNGRPVEFDATEDDLVRALRRESADVSDAASMLRRLQSGGVAAAPTWRRSALLAGAAASVVVLALTLAALVHARNPVPAPDPGSGTPPHLSLAPVARYAVSNVAAYADREVLTVDYRPTSTTRYGGATITLYAAGVFDAGTFTATAQRLVTAGHVAYFGSYQHLHSLAWPVSGGRWVCLAGFVGVGPGTGYTPVRRAELAVAAGVVVR